MLRCNREATKKLPTDYISHNVAKRNPLADNGFTMPKKQQKNLNLIPEVRAAYDAEVKKLERYTEREIVSGALALWLMVPEDARIAAVALAGIHRSDDPADQLGPLPGDPSRI